ncbi:unnamed protein product [Schistosoma mattheei]|uniref:Uncharacterized protein n=1 Tax=Schistosoma mattheei TaxID=31246 RepID=A0A183PQ56_9TREM|nr:unnamed protein product [Schistosoma mattheei]
MKVKRAPLTRKQRNLNFLNKITKLGTFSKDDISMAGGDRNSEPTIVLNPGDPGPLDVNFGELLYSRCSVLDSNQYSYRWIQRAPDGTIKEISSDARLYITNFGPEHLQYPLRCEVTRLSDDETFEKVLNLRLASSGELSTDDEYKTLNLTIKPLPNEDFRQGTIMRQCLFENDPEINELFDFRWIDQNGRIVTNGDTLYLLTTDDSHFGTTKHFMKITIVDIMSQ